MHICGNKNLHLGLPVGSYAELDEYKTDFKDLFIHNVEIENEKTIRFDVKWGNNELHQFLSARNEEGVKDLKIIEENKQKFIGKTIEEIINFEF